MEHIQQYQLQLEEGLDEIDLPVEMFQCTDLNCTSSKHIEQLNQFNQGLINVCTRATRASIPMSKPSGKKSSCIPGWTPSMSAARDRSLFWHSLWVDNGKPEHGWVVLIMRSVRSAYHYQLRKLKRSKNENTQRAFSSALLRDNKDYWGEVKKIKGTSNVIATKVNGKDTAPGIASEFALKYDKLFNSVKSDDCIMKSIGSCIENDLHTLCDIDSGWYINNCVSCDSVKRIIVNMKRGKSGGDTGLCSDNFIHATDKFMYYITCIFNAILVHGKAPASFSMSVIVPIPKDRRGNLSSIDNYRAIALSDIMSKIFDSIVVQSQVEYLHTSDLQFGYKRKSSTIMCTTLLLETLQYFKCQGGPVYVLFIDASKAFDRLRHADLFLILQERKMCPVYLRVLFNMYQCQQAKIRWTQTYSDIFSLSNGVRQGGILSPLLFTIYIDNIFKRLEATGLGCYINAEFAGCFGYADDLVLIAPSLTGLKCMIRVCEEYAAQYEILYNPNKSKLLCFNAPEGIDIHVDLCGTPVKIVDSEIYLGNFVGSDLSDRNIISVVGGFYRRCTC